MRDAIRVRHYSLRTEEAYVGWIRRYVRFHGLRHPAELGSEDVGRFLSHLATRGTIGASTQNQALSALLFLYRDVLGRDFGWLSGIARAKRPHRLPVVLTRPEVRSLLEHLTSTRRLMAELLSNARRGRGRLRGRWARMGRSGRDGREMGVGRAWVWRRGRATVAGLGDEVDMLLTLAPPPAGATSPASAGAEE